MGPGAARTTRKRPSASTDATASRGSPVTMSTSPLRRASRRMSGSGMNRNVIRSARAFGPQYPSKRSTTSCLRGWYSTTLNGPVPTGGSVSLWESLGTIGPSGCTSCSGRRRLGVVDTKSTVRSSTLVTVCSVPETDRSSASRPVHDHTTSSAPKRRPSCHVTLGRRWKRHVEGPTISHRSARPGRTVKSGARDTSGSYTPALSSPAAKWRAVAPWPVRGQMSSPTPMRTSPVRAGLAVDGSGPSPPPEHAAARQATTTMPTTLPSHRRETMAGS